MQALVLVHALVPLPVVVVVVVMVVVVRCVMHLALSTQTCGLLRCN